MDEFSQPFRRKTNFANGIKARLVVVDVIFHGFGLNIEDVNQNGDGAENGVSLRGDVVLKKRLLSKKRVETTQQTHKFTSDKHVTARDSTWQHEQGNIGQQADIDSAAWTGQHGQEAEHEEHVDDGQQERHAPSAVPQVEHEVAKEAHVRMLNIHWKRVRRGREGVGVYAS